MQSRCLVVFKTHLWNDRVQRGFERLRDSVAQATADRFFLVLFADEVRGSLAIPDAIGVKVIRASTAVAAQFGLAATEGETFSSHDTDIPIAIAGLLHPEAAHIMVVDQAVAVQCGLDDIVDWVEAGSIDVIAQAPDGTPAPDPAADGGESWELRRLTCFCVLSRQAVFEIVRQRLALSHLLRTGRRLRAPHGDAFVATTLARAGLAMETLSDLGPMPHFSTDQVWEEEDLAGFGEELFVYPVVDAPDAVAHLLASDLASRRWADADLRARALRHPDETLPALYEAFRPRGDQAELAALRTDMRRAMSPAALARYGLDRVSIGRGCPAWQSSISPFSHAPDEARQALDHLPNGHYSFHTETEDRPWWMVDLQTVRDVESIRIYNRNFMTHRAHGLELYGSRDQAEWVLYDSHKPGVLFDGLDKTSLTLRVDAPVRYLRLELPHRDCLHLDHIDIFEGQQQRRPNFLGQAAPG